MNSATALRTKRLTYSGLLVAAGILLPQVFHLIGGGPVGSIFLPMHIPVLIAGLLCGPASGALVGALSPVLSSLLTGMPPMAKLPFMFCELIAYGFFAGLFTRRKWNVYFAMISSQVAGRVVYALALLAAAYLFRLDVPAVSSVAAAVVTGLPGIAIQLVLVPPVVLALRKAGKFYE
ncbi:ECF transporter S component [Hydrogenoanaerobacterium sp.]|uniref:ECF transporter S component n=1 Tax=Hydrogenoanaerobacterium sp. TaxID=2953763 RepID=UPI00289F3B63|nr:ECF transporter S component [Hydrogenoanaerobacterium sp.]